jgi:hypothetical protein
MTGTFNIAYLSREHTSEMFFDSCEIYHNLYHFLNLLGINQSRTVESMDKNSVTPLNIGNIL